MLPETARAAVKKYGSVQQAAKMLKASRSSIEAALGGKKQQQSGRTLEDFRKAHDQSWKIRDGLRRLFSGSAYMTDAEFREAVSGNPSRWRSAADAQEFAENRYRVSGEILWASKDTIRKMRQIRGEAI
jgi:hypothetical protein